jgi:tetratricopeptide (TPR) repeat protein
MGRQYVLYALLAVICFPTSLLAQIHHFDRQHSSEQVEVYPPPVRRADTPSGDATVTDLEQRADTLRSEKSYLDALDYYRAAVAKEPGSARIYNKIGITELQMGRFGDARKNFERSIKCDRQFADAYNNLGVIFYLQKKFGPAIKRYESAIKLREDSGSYFSNLGAAYFSKKDYVKASMAYNQALQLDPDIFDRTSHNGVLAQMSSPGDRARFYYVLAKLYAKSGVSDRSLQYLRRALEEGYKGIEDVYKDSEFAGLRKDPRFTELMAARPVAIPVNN